MGFNLRRTTRKAQGTSIFLLKGDQPNQRQKTHRHCFICLDKLTIFILIFNIIIMLQPEGVQGVLTDIKVNEHGVKAMRAGDTALVFYANVSHTGKEWAPAVTAMLHMEECCLLLHPNKTKDCESMTLHNGLAVVFHPNDTHILQMYFVNFDLYDREGSCAFRLLLKLTKPPSISLGMQKSWQNGPEFTIGFTTVLKKPGLFRQLFISLGGSAKDYQICNTDDYNSLHECSYYDDCLIRHAGQRSLFNKESNDCGVTPPCPDSKTHFLSIVTTKCEKIDDIVNVKQSFTYDVAHVDSSSFYNAISSSSSHHLVNLLAAKKNQSSAPPKPKLVCENGIRTITRNGRPNCTCYPGWRSMTREEWEKKGGGGGSYDEGMPYHHMCIVPLMEHQIRLYLIIGFIFISFLVPFIAMLVINQGKRNPGDLRKRKSSVKSLMLESGSSSSSDEGKDEERRNKTKAEEVGGRTKLSHAMEEEDADQVISEITNRREPKVGQPSTGMGEDGNDKSNMVPTKPEFPPSSESTATTHDPPSRQTPSLNDYFSHEQFKSFDNSTTSSLRHLSSRDDPVQSAQQHSPPSFSYSPTLRESHGSGGFYFGFSDYKPLDVDINNHNDAWMATQTQSVNDLLTVNNNENLGAHVPIEPTKEKHNTGMSVVMSNCALVELRDNNVCLHSLSAEEITLQKKKEWSQFFNSMKSLSHEQLYSKPDPNCTSVMQRGDDDLNDVEAYSTRNARALTDFQYFHKNHKPKASKVQSVPGMMQYHPFSAYSPSLPREELLEEITPPRHYYGDMKPKELQELQDCYRVLSSLSSERLSSLERVPKHTNSIWSNIASENAQEVFTSNTTPVTTHAPRLTSDCEKDSDDKNATTTSTETKTIHGDSVVSRNEASKKLIRGTSQLSNSPSYQQQSKRKMVTEQNAAQGVRTKYGHSNMMMPAIQCAITDIEGGPSDQEVVLESDLISNNNTYFTESSGSLHLANLQPSSSSGEFWKTVTACSFGGTVGIGGNVAIGINDTTTSVNSKDV